MAQAVNGEREQGELAPRAPLNQLPGAVLGAGVRRPGPEQPAGQPLGPALPLRRQSLS